MDREDLLGMHEHCFLDLHGSRTGNGPRGGEGKEAAFGIQGLLETAFRIYVENMRYEELSPGSAGGDGLGADGAALDEGGNADGGGGETSEVLRVANSAIQGVRNLVLSDKTSMSYFEGTKGVFFEQEVDKVLFEHLKLVVEARNAVHEKYGEVQSEEEKGLAHIGGGGGEATVEEEEDGTRRRKRRREKGGLSRGWRRKVLNRYWGVVEVFRVVCGALNFFRTTKRSRSLLRAEGLKTLSRK